MAAAAVENSWGESVKSGRGSQRSQMEECLSRSGQLHTGLAALLGNCSKVKLAYYNLECSSREGRKGWTRSVESKNPTPIVACSA